MNERRVSNAMEHVTATHRHSIRNSFASFGRHHSENNEYSIERSMFT